MSGPKISINADNSQVLTALDEIKKHALKISDSLNNKSSSPFDLESAKSDLKQLEALVQNYGSKMAQASKSGNLSGLNVDEMTTSLKEAVGVGEDLNSVLKHLNAGVDSSGMSKSVREQERISKFHQRAVKDMETMSRERMKFARGTKDVAEVEERLAKLRNAKTRGTSRVGANGESAIDYLSGGGGWQEYSLDKKTNERHRAELAEALGVSLDGGKPGGVRGFLGKHGDRMQAVGGAAMAGAITGGSAGAGIGSILGMAASFLPGGKFLAPLIGGAGGAIGGAMEGAISEGVTYSELRRAIGATIDEFEMLRFTVREGVDGMGVSHTEAANLANQFARTAGILKDEFDKVGGQVGDAVGFGRSYGVGADSSGQFFAQMRLFRASGGEQDNRRLALLIADSVQRGGTGSKMDEVLSVISSFTSTATRASYTNADVGGYSDLLSRLTGSATPGLAGSPGAAGDLLGRVDASIRSGGRYGDASRAFNLSSLQKYGVTGYDVDYFNETGILGTPRQALANMERFANAAPEGAGRDRKLAEIETMRSRFGSSLDEDNLTRMLREGEAYAGGNIDQLGEWGSKHTGLSKTEFQAFYSSMKRGGSVSNIGSQLSGAGIDLSTLNMRSLQDLVELSSGGSAGIKEQIPRLRKMALSREDGDLLSAAESSGDDEKLRNTVLRLTNSYSAGSLDEGEQAKNVQVEISNSLAEIATAIIPFTTDVKGLLAGILNAVAPDNLTNVPDIETDITKYRPKSGLDSLVYIPPSVASGAAQAPATAPDESAIYSGKIDRSSRSSAFSVIPSVDKFVQSQSLPSTRMDPSQNFFGRFELWDRGEQVANPIIIDTGGRAMAPAGGPR